MDCNNPHRLVALNFKPLWVYAIREFCSFFARAAFRAAFDDRAVGQRVAIIVHELVENAIRYGDDDELDLRIERAFDVEVEIAELDTSSELTITVKNHAVPSRIRVLERELSRAQSTSASNAFAGALKRLQRLPEGASMLGLSRIGQEASLELSTRGNQVIIVARLQGGLGTDRPLSSTRAQAG